jgi:hypothetical protein
VVVGDHEDAVANAGVAGGRSERVRVWQRVPPAALDHEIGERVDPEKRRARDMPLQVRVAAGVDAVERVAAVDEPVSDQ